jgi:hypothetical protein
MVLSTLETLLDKVEPVTRDTSVMFLWFKQINVIQQMKPG